LRVAFARGARSQQNLWTKYFVGLCGEAGNEKKMAAGLSSDGNRDNGEDKVLIYSKQKAPDSGSEGRNRRDTWRAGVRGTGERRVGPTRGCVDPRGLKTVWASAATNMWLETGIQIVGRTPYNVGIARRVVADN
jgi:hypothetical protein